MYAPRIEAIQCRRAWVDAALQQQRNYAEDASNNKSGHKAAIQAPVPIDENTGATANTAGKQDTNQHSQKLHIQPPVLCSVREAFQPIIFGADR